MQSWDVLTEYKQTPPALVRQSWRAVFLRQCQTEALQKTEQDAGSPPLIGEMAEA